MSNNAENLVQYILRYLVSLKQREVTSVEYIAGVTLPWSVFSVSMRFTIDASSCLAYASHNNIVLSIDSIYTSMYFISLNHSYLTNQTSQQLSVAVKIY